jgi:phosphate transport system protein
MPRETFQQELDGLTSDLLDLGREVEASLENMVRAMEGRDAGVARQELGVDVRYKTRGMDIERECMILQARQAPVARDLRLLYTVQSVTNHLVRSGTLCEHIYQAIAETADSERDEDLEAALVEMARTAQYIQRGPGYLQEARYREGPQPPGEGRQGGPPLLRGHEPDSQPV